MKQPTNQPPPPTHRLLLFIITTLFLTLTLPTACRATTNIINHLRRILTQ